MLLILDIKVMSASFGFSGKKTGVSNMRLEHFVNHFILLNTHAVFCIWLRKNKKTRRSLWKKSSGTRDKIRQFPLLR